MKLGATILAFPALVSLAGAAAAQEAPPAAPSARGEPAARIETLAPVMVTARKKEEGILEVPMAISQFGEQTLRELNIRSFADYATRVPGLSYAFGNGTTPGETGTGMANSRTIAIRGIAGAGTTAYYIDDTPLPGAIDLRVLDLAGIEILKGPQGTLFGEGSLGGTVRLRSKAPDLRRGELRIGLSAGHTQGAGRPNKGGSAVGNIVLAPGSAALRWVAFGDDEAGWLQRTYLSNIADPASKPVVVGDQAAKRSGGGSLSLLLRLSPELDLQLRLLHQRQRYQGFPASYAPLPTFLPLDTLVHTADIQTYAREDWTLPSLALGWQFAPSWRLHSSTSVFQRDSRDLEDSTEGTARFLAGTGRGAPPPPQGFAWIGERRHRQLSHETRLHFDPEAPLSATAGLYYARQSARRATPPTYGQDVLGQPGRSMMWVYDSLSHRQDISLFGELYYRWSEAWTATAGLRRYWLRQDNQSTLDGNIYQVLANSSTDNRTAGFNPKFALSWQADPRSLAYASASRGFRAGGSQFNLSTLLGNCVSAEDASRLARVAPDSAWSYELGGKRQFGTGGQQDLLLTGALYRIDWRQIQQPAFVPACAFYLQGNAGAARIDGAELELSGQLMPGLKLRLGLGYNDARITEQGSSRQPAGARIAHVPRWNAALALSYAQALTPTLTGFASASLSQVGNSATANNSGGQILVRPGYRLINARLALQRARSELALDLTNLGNARPNLGDISYLGYQRFEANGTRLPQVLTLPPRAFNLLYTRSFD